jgi:hypothetical protein
MAIIDNTLVFSDGQAITATAGSTNEIDLGATGTPVGQSTALVRDIGKGSDVVVEVLVTEAFNNLTSMEVTVQVDDDVAFGSPNEVASRTYLLAELTLGKRLSFPAEITEGANQRYLRLKYTVTGTAPTTGKVFAAVVAGRQNA